MTLALMPWIIGAVLSALGVGMAVKLYLSYRYGRKTQEIIDKDASFKKQKKAEEIAAKPAGSVDDIIDRL